MTAAVLVHPASVCTGVAAGVNSVDRRHLFERYLREASVLPLYDAGNFGMQRRRIHGVMAHSSFDPRAIMDNRAVDFDKSMEGIDTVPGPRAERSEPFVSA